VRTEFPRYRFLLRQLGPLSQPRLILLTGARQTGKTTLAREVYPDLAYVNLDAPEQREAVREVRADAWAETVGPAILDEAQKEPSLFDKVKYAFDAGQIQRTVLLGSSQILMLQRVRETLAGRAFVYELWPLLASELASPADAPAPEPLLDALLTTAGTADELLGTLPAVRLGEPATLGAAAVEHLLRWGGMPALLPLPDAEEEWEQLDVILATTRGTVRRNKLADFVNVNRNGKIAMKLEDESDGIVGVQTATDRDDVMLATSGGQCIRFEIGDLRVFQSRDSMGVRGISLRKGDSVISLSILRHVDASPAERDLYMRQASAIRRGVPGDDDPASADEPDDMPDETEDEEEAEAIEGNVMLSTERYSEMSALEQFVLTASEFGYGKWSSSYSFRVSRRGGKGIKATDTSKLAEIGHLVAAFPVEPGDEIMLVTDGGKMIRTPVEGIRFVSRASKGVRIFDTAKGEKVVSVEHIPEAEEADVEAGAEADEPAQDGGAPDETGTADDPEEPNA